MNHDSRIANCKNTNEMTAEAVCSPGDYNMRHAEQWYLFIGTKRPPLVMIYLKLSNKETKNTIFMHAC